MNGFWISLLTLVFLLSGCGNEKIPVAPGEVTDTGKIVLNVTWPQGVAGKKAEVLRDAPDKITAYLYRSGKEVTRTDLKHEGTCGTAEFTVAAQTGYRLEIVASSSRFDQVLYTGFKDGITVSADTSTTVDITMFDAAPVLFPAKTTGDSSFVIFWSRVPLAVSYLLEESASPEFTDEFGETKLSTTVYSGSDSTKTFTDKESGTFYYAVSAVTQYEEAYTSSFSLAFYFYLLGKYGALSNIVSVESGATGSLKIDIPWPIK